MARKRSKSSKGGESVSPLAEVLAELDRIKQDTSPGEVRLHADLARDAVVEVFRQVQERLRHLSKRRRKLKRQRHNLRARLVDLLHELSTGPVVLPRRPGRPLAGHEWLTATYRRLREVDFPGLALAIHEASGKKNTATFQLLLMEEVLVRGSRVLAEQLVRLGGTLPAEDETFLNRLRDHIAGKVCSRLARQMGYPVTPLLGKQLHGLIGLALPFLEGLLTAAPPGRLIVPRPGSRFDPARHEPIGGQRSTGELKVTETLFPGYVILSDPPRVVERAQVYVERKQSKRSGPPPLPGS